ncbi:MAG TPA: phage holin family protein [Candidatus Limnocylindrales bacterium]
MFEFVVRVVVNAIALIAALRLVPHVEFRGDWWQLLILAAIVGVINAYIRPIVKLLSLPLNLLTFGLIGFVINTALIMLAAAVGQSLSLGFTLAHWPPGSITVDVVVAALLTSIVISVVSSLMAFVRLATPRL